MSRNSQGHRRAAEPAPPSSSDEEDVDCPLCMEEMDLSDQSFYPCPCGYQICRFCWHHIRNEMNGLCPACRRPYSDNPVEFTPLTPEEIARIKAEKKQKRSEKRQREVQSRRSLAGIRVVQKNLVYVIGISPRIAEEEVLRRNEYFGQFGRIHKIVVNRTMYPGPTGPSVSAYVTYVRKEDAAAAIHAMDGVVVDNRSLRCSLGTTKYCSYFLRGVSCPNADCMYLHEVGDEASSYTKEDIQQGLANEEIRRYRPRKDGAAPATVSMPVGHMHMGGHVRGHSAEGGDGSDEYEESPQTVPDVRVVTHVIPGGNGTAALPAKASWASSMKPAPQPAPPQTKGKSGQRTLPVSVTIGSAPATVSSARAKQQQPPTADAFPALPTTGKKKDPNKAPQTNAQRQETSAAALQAAAAAGGGTVNAPAQRSKVPSVGTSQGASAESKGKQQPQQQQQPSQSQQSVQKDKRGQQETSRLASGAGGAPSPLADDGAAGRRTGAKAAVAEVTSSADAAFEQGEPAEGSEAQQAEVAGLMSQYPYHFRPEDYYGGPYGAPDALMFAAVLQQGLAAQMAHPQQAGGDEAPGFASLRQLMDDDQGYLAAHAAHAAMGGQGVGAGAGGGIGGGLGGMGAMGMGHGGARHEYGQLPDDLGFDPWNESAKGLADMLRGGHSEHGTPQKHPHGAHAGAVQGGGGAGGSSAHPPPMPQYMPWQLGYPMALAQAAQGHPLGGLPFLAHPPYGAAMGQPGRGDGAGDEVQVVDERQYAGVPSWQANLRALFPNVNISFGPIHGHEDDAEGAGGEGDGAHGAAVEGHPLAHGHAPGLEPWHYGHGWVGGEHTPAEGEVPMDYGAGWPYPPLPPGMGDSLFALQQATSASLPFHDPAIMAAHMGAMPYGFGDGSQLHPPPGLGMESLMSYFTGARMHGPHETEAASLQPHEDEVYRPPSNRSVRRALALGDDEASGQTSADTGSPTVALGHDDDGDGFTHLTDGSPVEGALSVLKDDDDDAALAGASTAAEAPSTAAPPAAKEQPRPLEGKARKRDKKQQQRKETTPAPPRPTPPPPAPGSQAAVASARAPIGMPQLPPQPSHGESKKRSKQAARAAKQQQQQPQQPQAQSQPQSQQPAQQPQTATSKAAPEQALPARELSGKQGSAASSPKRPTPALPLAANESHAKGNGASGRRPSGSRGEGAPVSDDPGVRVESLEREVEHARREVEALESRLMAVMRKNQSARSMVF